MKDSKELWGALAIEMVAFCVLVTSVSLLWRNNLLLCGVAALECVVALILWHDRLDLSFFLIISVLGTLAEIIFVRFGAWDYNNPSILGVPLWFPFAFGTTGLIGGRLARTLTALWDKVVPSQAGERAPR